MCTVFTIIQTLNRVLKSVWVDSFHEVPNTPPGEARLLPLVTVGLLVWREWRVSASDVESLQNERERDSAGVEPYCENVHIFAYVCYVENSITSNPVHKNKVKVRVVIKYNVAAVWFLMSCMQNFFLWWLYNKKMQIIM